MNKGIALVGHSTLRYECFGLGFLRKPFATKDGGYGEGDGYTTLPTKFKLWYKFQITY